MTLSILAPGECNSLSLPDTQMGNTGDGVLTDGGKGDESSSLIEREERGNEGGRKREGVRLKGRVGGRRG